MGRFEILRLLGEGGYARVYLAQDGELGRYVSLKVPKAERFRTEQALESFFDEARFVASLEHPNIVRVFDVVRDPTGTRYIVMQYVDGEPLSSPQCRNSYPPPTHATVVSCKCQPNSRLEGIQPGCRGQEALEC